MKYATFYERTILTSIDLQYYEDAPTNGNAKELIDFVYNIFKSEFVHQNNKHLQETHLFKEWLQGLPSVFNIPFYNYDILNLAKADGFNLMTETAEDNFLEMYWANLSTAFFTLKNNL